VRLGHNISAESVTFDQALTPYGEIYATSGTASYGENNFTGDVQAIVSGTSGLWDTPNRELGTVPARWLSPDPAQSGWNPYAYATNPNSMINPSGLATCKVALPMCTPNGGLTSNYSDDPLELLDWSNSQEFGGVGGTVGADSSSGTAPQICNCLDDLTSGVLAGTGSPLPGGILGPELTDSGTPSGISIVGLAFQYIGDNCCYLDSNGNLASLFPSIDQNATIYANAWILQVTNENGQAMSGNFIVTETVNTVSGNVDPLVDYNYTWETNSNGNFVDNIVLAPNDPNVALSMQNRQSFTINGAPATTVMNQFGLYLPGYGLSIGNPWYANP
jgi:RHS repeat-associated protein